MSPGNAIALTTRSDSKTLPALDDSPAMHDLLDTEARRGAWRIVELYSGSGAPFEVELAWSSGSGAGASARLTVARATRVSVFARSLMVRAANLSSEENRVGVNVADGHAVTRNVLEQRGSLEENSATELPVPAFATGVRLELADPSLLPAASVRIYDGEEVLRSSTTGDEQPSSGVPLGCTGKLEVLANSATAFRAVFFLSL